MEKISLNSTNCHDNSDTCKILEYNFKNKVMNAALATITGRYPATGQVVNEACAEVAYIIKGQGKIVLEGETTELEVGDSLLINPGDRYYWDGNFEMLVVCSPAWYAEQHKEIE